MTEHGTVHQSSCSCTSKQNGRQRGKRQLLATIWTLLFMVNIPEVFWNDIVFTGYCLINRILYPFFMVNHYTPVSLLTNFILFISSDFWMYLFCSTTWY